MTLKGDHHILRLPGTLAAVAALLGLLALPLVLAPRADAYIYLASGPIGRANLDGTDLELNFIDSNVAFGLAVDGRHVYWSRNRRSIGRARLDGTSVNRDFIGGVRPDSVAVDASHVYWTDDFHTIGRANLDGTNVNRAFISGVSPGSVAVDASHIYWTNYDADTIGRANLDGTNVNQAFISGVSPGSVAVDASHIYWLAAPPPTTTPGPGGYVITYYPGSIGRANLDGTSVEQSFISGLNGSQNMTAVVTDVDHVYWGQYSFTRQGDVYDSRIGRADIDGTNVDQDFVFLGEHRPLSLAVDGLTDSRVAGKASATKTQRQTGKQIVVRVKVKAKEQLTAKATGKIKVNPTYKLKPRTAKLAAGETQTLKLTPKKAQAKKIAAALKHGKKATAKLKVKLSDVAGNTKTKKLSVRLRR